MIRTPIRIETQVRAAMQAAGLSRQARGTRKFIDKFWTGGPRILDPKHRGREDDDGIRFLKGLPTPQTPRR